MNAGRVPLPSSDAAFAAAKPTGAKAALAPSVVGPVASASDDQYDYAAIASEAKGDDRHAIDVGGVPLPSSDAAIAVAKPTGVKASVEMAPTVLAAAATVETGRQRCFLSLREQLRRHLPVD